MNRLDETSLEIESVDTQDGYQLEVHQVAELLGVTRTRVSQLTSNGQLSFERRRVGSRNRLYYKKSEVLAHQRGFYGRQVAASAFAEGRAGTVGQSTDQNADLLRRGASSHSIPLNAGHTGFVADQGQVQLSRLEEQTAENQRLLVQLLNAFARNSSSNTPVSATHTLHTAAEQREREHAQLLQQSILLEIKNLARTLEKQQDQMSALKQDFLSIRKDLFQLGQSVQRINADRRQRLRVEDDHLSDVSEPMFDCSNSRKEKSKRPKRHSVFRSSSQRKRIVFR